MFDVREILDEVFSPCDICSNHTPQIQCEGCDQWYCEFCLDAYGCEECA